MKRIVSLMAVLLLMSPSLNADTGRFSVSTNFLDYMSLVTVNLDASYALSRHWSVLAGARYNPFTYNKDDPQRQFQYRQRSCAVGARWWPWHNLSGWWFAGKARYQEYNIGGITSRKTEEGDRGGLGMYAGYTYMLSPHLNLEFGFGMWGGMSWYKTYSCQNCGITLNSGKAWFVRPDDIMMSLVYVF